MTRPSPSPNFFVIGAPKCGTTALFDMLRQHPEVYMSPVKEPHFFTFEGEVPIFSGPGGYYYRRYAVQNPRDYLLLFAAASNQRAIGEVSPSYLFSPVAASRIKKNYPDSKIIVLLRQPADRAYSRFQYNRFHLLERMNSFEQALEMERTRKEAGWLPVFLYKEEGYYYRNLKKYYDYFPPQNIKVYLYDEFNQSPFMVLQDLFRFLEVEADFKPELRRKNVTVVPKMELVHRVAVTMGKNESPFAKSRPGILLAKIVATMNHKYNLIAPPPLHPLTRKRLTDEYQDDIMQLQALISRDLSSWLEPR